jgi:putative CocE/NonD family hydrolase
MNRVHPLAAGVLLLAVVAAAPAQDVDAVRASYTKYEYRIPMRDGVRLFTAVYVPKDRSRTYPILMQRTPYGVGPYGADSYKRSLGPSEHFQKEGFIFVYQDVRGRLMSEGEFVEMRPHVSQKRGPKDVDESSDTYDSIDFLLRTVSGHNGKVGLWGISYPGFYAAAALAGHHPALKASSPQAPVADFYLGDDSYHNGAFLLAHNFSFYAFFTPRSGGPAKPETRPPFQYGTPDGYDYFLRLGTLKRTLEALRGNAYFKVNLDHPTYDEFWKARAIWRHMKGVKAAVLTVGGWFDAEDLQGPLRLYRAIEESNPGTYNVLAMGPWAHGGWAGGDGDRLGNLDFASKAAAHYRERIEFPFFMEQLKGQPAKLPEASVFETGRNEWHAHDAWPPRHADRRRLYFGSEGRLSWEPPAEPEAFDEYLSDPNRPVPLVAYTAQGMPWDYMTEDQRFASTRPDVLVYDTGPLENDVAVAGPVEVELHVATTGTDSDFVVKLVDVYPGDMPTPMPSPTPVPPASQRALTHPVKLGGYQQLVRGEPFRGKFRNGFEKGEPFVPGQPSVIKFSMPDITHAFRTGHRIMVQVQSSWFPYIDRNPQKFMNIPDAEPSDFRKATQRVFRGKSRPSSVGLYVLRARAVEPAAN